jgi:hypothetical protein
LIPVAVLFGILLGGLYREAARWKQRKWRGVSSPHFPLILGGSLAGVAMVFHSFGDFNLQMPATVWLLAAVAALSLASVLLAPENEA